MQRFRVATQGRLSCFKAVLPELQGKRGLEIGGPSVVFRAWFRPFPVYRHVSELDNCVLARTTVWAEHSDDFNFYPGKKGRNIFCEASYLPSIADESYDFVLSSHNLEHLANPIRALKEWIRVLRPGGTLVIVLPHYAKTPDFRRKPTPLQHMVEDYERGVGEDDLSHVDEVHAALILDPKNDPDELRSLLKSNFSHRMMHHHVFNESNSRALLEAAGLKVIAVEMKLPFHIFLVAQAPI